MGFTNPLESEKNLWKQNTKVDFKYNENGDFSSASERETEEPDSFEDDKDVNMCDKDEPFDSRIALDGSPIFNNVQMV